MMWEKLEGGSQECDGNRNAATGEAGEKPFQAHAADPLQGRVGTLQRVRLTANVTESTAQGDVCLLTDVKSFGSPVRAGV